MIFFTIPFHRIIVSVIFPATKIPTACKGLYGAIVFLVAFYYFVAEKQEMILECFHVRK